MDDLFSKIRCVSFFCLCPKALSAVPSLAAPGYGHRLERVRTPFRRSWWFSAVWVGPTGLHRSFVLFLDILIIL